MAGFSVAHASLAGLAAAPAWAQELLELRDRYVAESRLLDADIDTYLEAREREREALRSLVQLNRRLDQALADPSVPATELGELDRQIAQARELAFQISVDVGERRREMAERMRRIQAMVEEFRREGVSLVEPNGLVGGSWLIDFNGVLGLLSMEQTRARVSGLLRLSNGRRGEVTGSLRGQRLRLEFSDFDSGGLANLDGRLDEDGRLGGQWSAREVAAGRPSGGTWTAERVSLEDILGLEP